MASRTLLCMQQFRFDTLGILSFVLTSKAQLNIPALNSNTLERILAVDFCGVSKVTLAPSDTAL